MSVTLPHSVDRDTVRPPQFGLRTMLLVVTLLSGVFAVFSAVGAMWSAMLALFASLVLLHIVGNALGTRLRNHHDGERFSSAEHFPSFADAPQAPTIVPAKRLQENTSVRRPWLIAAALSATFFGSMGGLAIATLVGDKLTVPGLAVGVISAAVLGGLFGFLACSFWSVARNAWREALEATDDRSEIANSRTEVHTE